MSSHEHFDDGSGTSVTSKFSRGRQPQRGCDAGRTPTEHASAEKQSSDSKSELSGISVQDVDARTARQLGVPAGTSGVVVTKVDPSSAAADSGLQRGDVIQSES